MDTSSQGWTQDQFWCSHKEGKNATGVVLRNEMGAILGAWVNHFTHENAYCAEIEAAIQALKISDSLQLDRVPFEGDAMLVILALQGLNQFQEWKAQKQIDEG